MYLSDKKTVCCSKWRYFQTSTCSFRSTSEVSIKTIPVYLVQQSGWSATVWGLQIGDLLLYKPVESNADYNQVQEDVPIIDHCMSHNFLTLNATNGS